MAKTAMEGVNRGTLFYPFPEELLIVGVDRYDGSHPRFRPRALLPTSEKLVRSINAIGVIQPVSAWKDGSDWFVEPGVQRIKAAREVNLRRAATDAEAPFAGLPRLRVPALVVRGDDKVQWTRATSENAIRQNDDPITEARIAQHGLDMGMATEEVAEPFGFTAKKLRLRLDLLDLADEVQAAVAARRLKPSAALAMRNLPRTEQAKALAALQGNKVTAAALLRAAREIKGGEPPASPKTPAGISRPHLRRLCDTIEQGKCDLDDAVAEVLLVIAGRRPPETIPGLVDALKALGLLGEG